MHIGSSYAVQNNQSLHFMKTSQFLLFTNTIACFYYKTIYTHAKIKMEFLCMLHSSFVLARIFVRYSHCCALDVYKSLILAKTSTPHLDVLINTHLFSGILVT